MSRWSCHIMEVNLDSFCCPFHNCLFIFHLLNVAPGLLLLWRFVSSRTFCIFDSSWQWARTSVFSFSRYTGFPIGTTFFLECRFSSLEPYSDPLILNTPSFLSFISTSSPSLGYCASVFEAQASVHFTTTLLLVAEMDSY